MIAITATSQIPKQCHSMQIRDCFWGHSEAKVLKQMLGSKITVIVVLTDTVHVFFRSDAAATIYFVAHFVWLLFEGNSCFFGKPWTSTTAE